jgi:hypothetical protein
VTIGPPGSAAYRFISALASVTEATHPRVRVELVQVADLAASAKAIEDHTTDLGIARSDGPTPSNGETIAILRRDVVAFGVPKKSSLDSMSALQALAIRSRNCGRSEKLPLRKGREKAKGRYQLLDYDRWYERLAMSSCVPIVVFVGSSISR